MYMYCTHLVKTKRKDINDVDVIWSHILPLRTITVTIYKYFIGLDCQRREISPRFTQKRTNQERCVASRVILIYNFLGRVCRPVLVSPSLEIDIPVIVYN